MMTEKQGDQPKMRTYRFFLDQHGRRWGANIEINTGDPCGAWEPQFSAPLMPPPEYLRIGRDPNTRVSTMAIDYDAWIARFRSEDAEWVKQERKLMAQRHREKYSPAMPTDADVLDMLGPRPSIAPDVIGGTVQPIVAAKAGNKWVLGLTTVRDPRVAKYFVQPDPEAEDDYATEYLPDEDYGEVEEVFDPEAVGRQTPRKRGRPKKTEPTV